MAIELQRSPQTLREFLARQARYQASNVDCYWLLRQEVYLTTAKASQRKVLKRLGGWPADGSGIGLGLLPELPTSILRTEDSVRVLGGFAFNATVPEWLNAIVQGTYGHRDWTWWLDAKGTE